MAQTSLLCATGCSDRTLLSMAAGLWASRPNCSHSSAGRACHLSALDNSSQAVESVASLARRRVTTVQEFPILYRLNCLSSSFSFALTAFFILPQLSEDFKWALYVQRMNEKQKTAIIIHRYTPYCNTM